MKKERALFGLALAIFASLALLLSGTKAKAQIETLYLTNSVHLLNSSNYCAGKNYGFIQYTNSTGARWLVPPAGTSYGIIGNMNGSYTVDFLALRKGDLREVCIDTSGGFDASDTNQYDITGYVVTPAPPVGTVFVVELLWY